MAIKKKPGKVRNRKKCALWKARIKQKSKKKGAGC